MGVGASNTMAKSTTERGYDGRHKRNRERMLHQLADGTPCEECGRPMYRDRARNFDHAPLEADHHAQPLKYATNKRAALADRLIHRTCNRAGGAWDSPQPAVVNPIKW